MQTQAQFIRLIKSLFKSVLDDDIWTDNSFSIYIDKSIRFNEMEGLYLNCKKHNYTFLTCAEEDRFEILITKNMAASAAA